MRRQGQKTTLMMGRGRLENVWTGSQKRRNKLTYEYRRSCAGFKQIVHISCSGKDFLSNLWLHHQFVCVFLASQDALEVMGVSESVSHWTLADLTDVTLVSDDTN